jgi:hypothetical protein
MLDMPATSPFAHLPPIHNRLHTSVCPHAPPRLLALAPLLLSHPLQRHPPSCRHAQVLGGSLLSSRKPAQSTLNRHLYDRTRGALVALLGN